MNSKKSHKVNKRKTTHQPRQPSRFFIGHDRDYFIENLSMLVSSGMNIISVLDAISAEVRSQKMREMIGWIKNEVSTGSPIWKTLEKTKLFPSHTISLIRAGEASGKLAENLKIISKEHEKEQIFRSKISSAMMYPIFVLAVTLVVGIGTAWFILPKLMLVFKQLKIELPLITRMLMAVGAFLGSYGAIVVPLALIIFALFIYFTFFFPKTKFIGQILLFSLPGVKMVIKNVEIARFGYLLSTLLSAGISVVETLSSVEKATLSPYYKKLYAHLKQSVGEGNSFQKSFASFLGANALIPVPIQQLIIAGEQSGTLSETFFKINEIFEEKMEAATKNLTVILEPLLLVIIWIAVVAVALAVILPIYNLIGGFKTQ